MDKYIVYEGWNKRVGQHSTVVLQGFAVLLISQILLALLVGSFYEAIPSVPKSTWFVLSSVVAWTVITIGFLRVKTGYMPKFTINTATVSYSIIGIVLMWLFLYLWFFQFGVPSYQFKAYINDRGIYRIINLCWSIVLGPITEEIIYRGYFLKLLQPLGNILALLITSLLFTGEHLFFNLYSFNITMLANAVSFFFFSINAGIIFLRSGLVSAVLIHIFSNLYFLSNT